MQQDRPAASAAGKTGSMACAVPVDCARLLHTEKGYLASFTLGTRQRLPVPCSSAATVKSGLKKPSHLKTIALEFVEAALAGVQQDRQQLRLHLSGQDATGHPV